MIRILAFLILFFSCQILFAQGKITRTPKHPNNTSQMSSVQGILEKDTLKLKFNQHNDAQILSSNQESVNWSVIRPSASISHSAPELNCSVEVKNNSLQNFNSSIFNALQTAVTTYLNNTSFTDAQFAANEKICCKLMLAVKNYDDSGIITCDIAVQSQRPVYGSTYTTVLLNVKDYNITFNYNEGNPLICSESSANRQLTAILNFYAYLIIANDFDTFSLNGGNSLWEKINRIVHEMQISNDNFLKYFGHNNSNAELLRNFDNIGTKSMREFTYRYHRTGLDEMSQNPSKARANIRGSLYLLKRVYDNNPMSISLLMFRDSKLDELVNIFNNALLEERMQVYNLLQSIYPTELYQLEKIKNGHN